MTPVDPIATSGSAMPRNRRHPGAYDGSAFTLPDDGAAEPVRTSPMRSVENPPLPDSRADGGAGAEGRFPRHASQIFVDAVAQVATASQRLTGWFVDITV